MRYLLTFLGLVLFLPFGFCQKAIPFRQGDLWGFANEQGNIIIRPKYEGVGEFFHGRAWVKKRGKYGFINRTGRIVIRPKFEKVLSFGGPQPAAYVTKKGDSYCINKTGMKVRCRFGCGGAVQVSILYDVYSENGKYGLRIHSKRPEGTSFPVIDTLPAIWTEFRPSQNRFAAVQYNDKWGIIDQKGRLVLDYYYNDILVNPYENNRRKDQEFIIVKDGQFGFMDANLEVMIAPKYYKAEYFNSRGLAKVWLDENFWGYIDKSGREYFVR